MPEPHILLTVVQPAASGRPAPSAAWRAGAWPRPAGSTQPIRTSSTLSAATARPLDGGGDRARAERRGGDILQIAEKAAHRRARGADDDNGVSGVHGPCSLSVCGATIARRLLPCKLDGR